jgi:hypothetical protein
MPTDSHGHYFGSKYESDEAYRRSVGTRGPSGAELTVGNMRKLGDSFAKMTAVLADNEKKLADLRRDMDAMKVHRAHEDAAREARASVVIK